MSNIDGISEPLKGKDLDEWLLKHSEVEADAHDSSEYESKGLNRKVSGGRNSVKDMAKAGAGALETAMSAATGILSNVTGGYLGLGRATWNLASGEEIGKSFARGGETARRVSEGGTYEPRTDAGKAYTQVANLPVEVGSKVGGKVGGSIGQAVGGDEGEEIGRAHV